MNAPTPAHNARVMARRQLFRKLLGHYLNELRVRMGLSQLELAVRACVSRTQIHKTERGLSNEGIDTVQSICEALHVSFGEVISHVEYLMDHPEFRPLGKLLHLVPRRKAACAFE